MSLLIGTDRDLPQIQVLVFVHNYRVILDCSGTMLFIDNIARLIVAYKIHENLSDDFRLNSIPQHHVFFLRSEYLTS